MYGLHVRSLSEVVHHLDGGLIDINDTKLYLIVEMKGDLVLGYGRYGRFAGQDLVQRSGDECQRSQLKEDFRLYLPRPENTADMSGSYRVLWYCQYAKQEVVR